MMATEHGSMAQDGLKKFLFDTDFSLDEPEPAPVETSPLDVAEESDANEVLAEPEFVEEIAPTFSEEELAQAREEGVQSGREAAIADMTTALEQQMVNSLNAISEQMDRMFETYAQDSDDHSRNAIAVASVIMQKLFPSLNAENAMTEIESVITEALHRTSGAPSLRIKVPETVHEELSAKVKEMAALRGREGKINVVADADMTEGNIQIEWDGGGIFRDTAQIWEQIDGIIERNLGTSLENFTQPELKQDEPEPETTEILASEPEQEVVKEDIVGENKDLGMESQETAEITTQTTPAAPLDESAQPADKEPED